MRLDIAQNGDNVNWEKYGIPAKFLPVLKHLKYSSKATSDMYIGCTDPITKEEWERFGEQGKRVLLLVDPESQQI